MEKKSVCRYHIQGRCKFGDNCYFQHYILCPLVEVSLFKSKPIHAYSMRHGQSRYNLALDSFVSYYGNDCYSQNAKEYFQYDVNLIDCNLTQKGANQALQAQKNIAKIQIDLVFVSPLQRALQTANIIFQNRKEVEIIVLPQITEILSKICDISSSIKKKRLRYKHMNFSLLEENELDWQTSLLEKKNSQQLKKKIKCNNDKEIVGDEEISNHYFKLMKQYFPDPIQSVEKVKIRVAQGIKKIRSICTLKGIDRILIVTHRRVLKELTKINQYPDGIKFDNCEYKEIII